MCVCVLGGGVGSHEWPGPAVYGGGRWEGADSESGRARGCQPERPEVSPELALDEGEAGLAPDEEGCV